MFAARTQTRALALLATPTTGSVVGVWSITTPSQFFLNICIASKRPPMGGFQMTMFLAADFPKILPRRRGHGPELKNCEKSGGQKQKF